MRQSAAEAQPPNHDNDNALIERDPEGADEALSARIGDSAGGDPAKAELAEAAVAPVGVAQVDVIATPPAVGAAPAQSDRKSVV